MHKYSRILNGKHYAHDINPLKPHSNRPLYSNTVIGTLAVDGWAVTFGTARRGLGGLNVTAHYQRPMYQLHIMRCGTIITCAH